MLVYLKQSRYLILSLIILTFLLRIINFSFPAFTSDEARLSFRAFTLSNFGKDELGRGFPLVFNSLTDYQLPVTSYISAFSVFLFGKSDLGIRIIFTLIGTGVIFLSYRIAQFFSSNIVFPIYTSLVLAFSPVLIFLSKIPNDTIILIFLLELIFYLQATGKNKILMILAIIFSMFISKFAWFVIPSFVITNLFFYQTNITKATKVKLSFVFIIIIAILVSLFLKIPQMSRGLIENNFSFFTDTSVQPAINRLRGQGIESGWPNFLEKIIFNKLHFPVIAMMHWLSNLSPSIYFGQFDKSGLLGFTHMGAMAKILIVPFAFGLIYLITKGSRQEKLLLVYFVILTWPAFFSYPNYYLTLIVLTLPFLALIISFGLLQFKKVFLIFVALVVVWEVLINLLYIPPEVKNTSNLRPEWAKEITKDIYNLSKLGKVAVSDNIITEDIIPLIQWYNSKDSPFDYSNISYPYKFRQSELNNIKIIGSDTTISTCKYNDYPYVFLSKRDIDRMNELDFKVTKSYKDSLNKDVSFTLERGLCIR